MSYTNFHTHIVFATKNRRAMLIDRVMQQLLPYMGGIIRNLSGTMLAANGPEDHLHILATLPPTIAPSDFVRNIKASSSKWIHNTFSTMASFRWQDGYSAFSVSHSITPRVIEYIRKQQEHHKVKSFDEELIALLELHKIKFDDRYVGK
ncbi:MAG: IS200/IS605 family transposase [Phycisphaerae bacterium]|nr:IS200/IS605 family transposase [Phycisphaerae bacterium]